MNAESDRFPCFPAPGNDRRAAVSGKMILMVNRKAWGWISVPAEKPGGTSRADHLKKSPEHDTGGKSSSGWRRLNPGRGHLPVVSLLYGIRIRNGGAQSTDVGTV